MSCFEQRAGHGFNLIRIRTLQWWIRRNFDSGAALVMERSGDRNLIFLRLCFEGGTADIEAAWLEGLRRERLDPEASAERLRERFQRRVTCAS